MFMYYNYYKNFHNIIFIFLKFYKKLMNILKMKIFTDISKISMEIIDFGNFHEYYENFIHIHFEPKFYIDPFKKQKYRGNIGYFKP